MKKRLFAVLACCLALLMVLTACGTEQTDPTPAGTEPPAENTGSAEAEPVTITYCNFNASGGNEETLQRMYEAFHEEYPNITVEIETIAMDDYFTQLQTRIVGGTAPDCFEMNIENFAAYANMGALAPIEGVDISGMDETALSAFTVDGVQYGLPGNFSNVVLVYNKDLFDQANLEYPTSDWTQEDVQAAAERGQDRVHHQLPRERGRGPDDGRPRARHQRAAHRRADGRHGRLGSLHERTTGHDPHRHLGLQHLCRGLRLRLGHRR